MRGMALACQESERASERLCKAGNKPFLREQQPPVRDRAQSLLVRQVRERDSKREEHFRGDGHSVCAVFRGQPSQAQGLTLWSHHRCCASCLNQLRRPVQQEGGKLRALPAPFELHASDKESLLCTTCEGRAEQKYILLQCGMPLKAAAPYQRQPDAQERHG